MNVVPFEDSKILLVPLAEPPVLSAMEEPATGGVTQGWYGGRLSVCTTGGRLFTIRDSEIVVVPDLGLPVNEAVKERVEPPETVSLEGGAVPVGPGRVEFDGGAVPVGIGSEEFDGVVSVLGAVESGG